MRTLRPRLTYANVVSTLALVLVIAGGGTAVAAIAKNSVGSAQIKNAAIKGKDVKGATLTSKHVKDGSLTSLDIDDSTLANSMIVAGEFGVSGTLAGSGTKVASVTFTVPSAGFVLVIAHAELDAGHSGSYIGVDLQEDGRSIGQMRDWDPGDGAGSYDVKTATYALPVAAGSHTYDLVLQESTPGPFTQYSQAQLVVQFSSRGETRSFG